MPSRQKARDPAQGQAKIIATARLHHPGVQRHAHPQRTAQAPCLRSECTLACERGADCVQRVGKGRVDGIPNGLEDHPASCRGSVTQECLVAGDSRAHLL
jgi:hypothetical protein